MLKFELQEKRTGSIFFMKIICTEEEQIQRITSQEDSIIVLNPVNFPETEYIVEIITEKDDIDEILLLIVLEDERKMVLSLEIYNGKIAYKDFKSVKMKFEKIDQNEMKEREKLAVELFISDEGLMEELMDLSDNPEQDMSLGEIESIKVAQKTWYLDEETALSYINYNVVKAPDSVWNRILDKYRKL